MRTLPLRDGGTHLRMHAHAGAVRPALRHGLGSLVCAVCRVRCAMHAVRCARSCRPCDLCCMAFAFHLMGVTCSPVAYDHQRPVAYGACPVAYEPMTYALSTKFADAQ